MVVDNGAKTFCRQNPRIIIIIIIEKNHGILCAMKRKQFMIDLKKHNV
jgi:hypothetical protein